jgi:hypothetical protein
MILKIEWLNKITTYLSQREIEYEIKEIRNQSGDILQQYNFFKENRNCILPVISINDWSRVYPQAYDRIRDVECPIGFHFVKKIPRDVLICKDSNFEHDTKNEYMIGRKSFKNICENEMTDGKWTWRKIKSLEEIYGYDFLKEKDKILVKKNGDEENTVGRAYLLNDNGKTIEIFR